MENGLSYRSRFAMIPVVIRGDPEGIKLADDSD